ncbi:MAG: xanthine dehydrogenase family protein subunit M [Spirochaetaceae bacterium]|nr:MAG: xanthine dehydrogenase family protein subunit M [Spirochaetaceae bacterium]
MKSFQYLRPETLSEAISLMERFGAGARPLLGGTDLMVRIQKGQAEPDAVVDMKWVGEIPASIEVEDGMITVGARVVLADLVCHKQIREYYPALAEAASIVGSIQIRNRATLVGNICNASPAADTVPPLMVYGASVTIVGAGSTVVRDTANRPMPSGSIVTREVPLQDFFLGPGKSVCGPAELVVGVKIPVPTPPFGSAFGRLTRRRGVDLAIINMACAIDAAGVTTFVFGAAGPKPILVRDESGQLASTDLPESKHDELLQSLIDKTSPISDVRSGEEYRRAMLLTFGRRVLHQAQARRSAAKMG